MILFKLFISCFSIKHHIVSCEPAINNVFNICFLENESLIQTTVSRGYILYARNKISKGYILSKNEIFKNSVEITTVTRNISNDQVSVSHSFKNILNSNNFIELAVYTTLCFESTCSVHASLVNMDGYYITHNHYELGLFFPKESNQPNISTLWVGQQKDIASNLFEDALEPEYSGYIGITYSWQKIYLEPHETKTTTMFFLNSNDFPEDFKPPSTFPYSKSSTYTQKHSDTLQSLPQPTQTFTVSGTFSSSQKFTASNKFTKSDTFTHSQTSTKIDIFTTSNTKSGTTTEIGIFTNSHTFSKSQSSTKTNTYTKSDTSTTTMAMFSSTPITESGTFSSNTDFTRVNYSPEGVSFTSSNNSGSKNDFSNGNSKSVNITMIAGIVAGVIVLSIAAVLTVFFIKKNKYPEIEPVDISIDKGDLGEGL